MPNWTAGLVAVLAMGTAFVVHAGNPSSGPAARTAIVADANGNNFETAVGATAGTFDVIQPQPQSASTSDVNGPTYIQ